jgi:hypothetical protein
MSYTASFPFLFLKPLPPSRPLLISLGVPHVDYLAKIAKEWYTGVNFKNLL